MRRGRLPPDKRLDWRDPNMPVLRKMRYVNKFGRETVVLERIDPDDEQLMAAGNMKEANAGTPNWRTDPTYDLANRKRKL